MSGGEARPDAPRRREGHRINQSMAQITSTNATMATTPRTPPKTPISTVCHAPRLGRCAVIAAMTPPSIASARMQPTLCRPDSRERIEFTPDDDSRSWVRSSAAARSSASSPDERRRNAHEGRGTQLELTAPRRAGAPRTPTRNQRHPEGHRRSCVSSPSARVRCARSPWRDSSPPRPARRSAGRSIRGTR